MLGKNAIRVLVFLLLQVASCGGEPCIISAVKKGEPATVTFYFTRDVSQEKEAIVVNNLDHNNGKTVLDCIWETSHFKCYSAPGYQREGNISDSLTMKISSFTEEHAGRYACQTMPPLTGDPVTCVLGLEGEKKGTVSVCNLSTEFFVSLSLNSVLLPAVVVLLVVVCRHIRDDPEKASEHGDNGPISKKDLEKGLSDDEDVFMDDTNQTNVKRTMNEPLLSNSPADDVRQEPSAENDNDSGYVRSASQDQDSDRELLTQVGDDNEQGEDEMSDEDEDDGIEEALEKADKAGPLSLGTPRTRRLRKKLKPVLSEIKEHGVEFLHHVPDEFKRRSAQREPRNVET